MTLASMTGDCEMLMMRRLDGVKLGKGGRYDLVYHARLNGYLPSKQFPFSLHAYIDFI